MAKNMPWQPTYRCAHNSGRGGLRGLFQGPQGAPCWFSWGTLRACPLSGAPVRKWHHSTRSVHTQSVTGVDLRTFQDHCRTLLR